MADTYSGGVDAAAAATGNPLALASEGSGILSEVAGTASTLYSLYDAVRTAGDRRKALKLSNEGAMLGNQLSRLQIQAVNDDRERKRRIRELMLRGGY